MTTLFVNRLTVIDNSLLSPSRGLIGESWQVDIELDGDLDIQGMVLDFGDVKKAIKRLIDADFDHKLLIPADYPGLTLTDGPDGLQLRFETEDGSVIEHQSPRDAVRLIPCARVASDRVAQIIADHLSPQTPHNVDAVRVRLWPETIDGAYYHYSHGLKKHNGNCQRIAHGHRSRIEITRNSQRDHALEAAWAHRLADTYVGTRADLTATRRRNGIDYCHFGYHSAQGEFRLSLPRSRCYLIDTDSTVENIAQHIADALKATSPGDRFVVYAYEGVDKGAVGRS